MTFPRARLAVSALLFVAWLGFLAYLVAVTRDTVVLSRPQILVSNLCVLAEVAEDGGKPVTRVVVTEVLWPKESAAALNGKELDLDEFGEVGPAQGWRGPGVYLLALNRRVVEGDTDISMTRIPSMPGFVVPEYRIYPFNDGVLSQFYDVKPRE